MPYGSITAQFQFHKGTIKPARCGSDGTRLYHFNSIKVRLNHALATMDGRDGRSFQFHKGTIKPIHLRNLKTLMNISIP